MASRSGAPSTTNVDPVETTEADYLDLKMEQYLSVLYTSLPDQPVSTTARRAAPSDGVDRISELPDALLRDIISRLPAKDAARTAVLATRWRGVWRSAPLVLIDTHLSDGTWPPTEKSAGAVVSAVSRALASHPGPFRCVRLVYSRMGERQAALKRWLRLLAAKGVQELVLVNRPWPREVPLPSTLFSLSTLTRLYIGVWKFPDAAGLRGVSFPHLRELGLCLVEVESGDIDAVVARSPVLEILNIQGSLRGKCLRLVSQSLRCVQVCTSVTVMESIEVVNAARLERLIVCEDMNLSGVCTRVKIGNAPKLKLFGYLEPGKHTLEIGDTVIMPGMEASPSMMLITVKILSLHVCFGVHKDIKMMPAFLRRFSNVESLHITSAKCDQPTDKLNLKFWEDEAGPIVNVLLRIRVMTFREFRGEQYELSFLQYFFKSTYALNQAVILLANPSFTSRSEDEMISSVVNMRIENFVNEFKVLFYVSTGPEGLSRWTFKRGAKFSDDDPFATVEIIPRPGDQTSQACKRHNCGL
ncbi:hypothetical protein ACQJBY_036820 [Aegilops geniculata]